MARSRSGFRPDGPTARPKAFRRPARPRHPCAGGRTAGPSRGQRGCGPPRTRFGGFPRFSTLRPRPGPGPQFRLAGRFSGSGSPHRVRRGRHGARMAVPNQQNEGYSPVPVGISPADRLDSTASSTAASEFGPRRGLQVTSAAPVKSAPRAARAPRAPVAPRSAALRVVEGIAAAAPERPTWSSFTRRAVK